MKLKSPSLSIIISVLAGLMIVFFSSLFFSGRRSEEKSQTRTTIVAKKDIRDILRLRGKVIPTKKVFVYSEASGQVIEIYAREGQVVKKGDVLLKIDQAQLQSRVDKQKMQMDKARISLESAQQDFKRNESLFKEQFISEQQYITSKKSLELASLDFSIAKNELDILDKQLGKIEVKSTVDGVILKKGVEEGDGIAGIDENQSGKVLFIIADPTEKKVELSLSEGERANLSLNQEVVFEMDTNPGKMYHGIISQLDASITQKESNDRYRGQVDILDEFSDLELDASVNVEVVIGQAENVIGVPVQAIFYEHDNPFVYLVKGSSFEKRKVRTGVSDIESVEVKDGLKIGDKVYLDEPASLH